jgi:hypothetical protein
VMVIKCIIRVENKRRLKKIIQVYLKENILPDKAMAIILKCGC